MTIRHSGLDVTTSQASQKAIKKGSATFGCNTRRRFLFALAVITATSMLWLVTACLGSPRAAPVHAPSVISGIVTTEVTDTIVQIPLSGFALYLQHTSSHEARVPQGTDESGRYLFTVTDAENYVVCWDASSGWQDGCSDQHSAAIDGSAPTAISEIRRDRPSIDHVIGSNQILRAKSRSSVR